MAHLFSMGKSTISMAIFNSYVTNYQRVSPDPPPPRPNSTWRSGWGHQHCLVWQRRKTPIPNGWVLIIPGNDHNWRVYPWYTHGIPTVYHIFSDAKCYLNGGVWVKQLFVNMVQHFMVCRRCTVVEAKDFSANAGEILDVTSWCPQNTPDRSNTWMHSARTPVSNHPCD